MHLLCGVSEYQVAWKSGLLLSSDTGYRGDSNGPVCPIFSEIKQKFGQIDFAAIPIWRGGTLNFITKWGLRVCASAVVEELQAYAQHHQLNPDALTLVDHATPSDAVSIHNDVGSRATIGIHFGTFAGSEDESIWPISLLSEACKDHGVSMKSTDDRCFAVTDVGQTVVIPVRS